MKAKHSYLLKASTAEFDQWRAAADLCGVSLAAWIRASLAGASRPVVSLDAPRGRPVATPVAGGTSSVEFDAAA